LDVRWLHRKGYLCTGRQGSIFWSRNGERIGDIQFRGEFNSIILTYRHRWRDEPWQREEYPVYLEWTACHYGGSRPWFICPARACERRVAVLYGSGLFACRECHQLAYESQREAPYSRALSRAQAIHEKLGGTGITGDPFPEKPKGMHHRTYWGLVRKYEHALNCSWPSWLFRAVVNEN